MKFVVLKPHIGSGTLDRVFLLFSIVARGAGLTNIADVILAMTGDHLEALLEHVPEVAPRTRLLHPQGHDVSDPVGADRDTYQRTASAIELYLSGLLDSLGL